MGEIMMFKIVNADVNLKGHKERSEFMAHFKLQSVLFHIFKFPFVGFEVSI